MEFMTVKQAAEKWGLSERRLALFCLDLPFNVHTVECPLGR